MQGEVVSGYDEAAITFMDLSTGFAKYTGISLFPNRSSLFLLLSHCRQGHLLYWELLSCPLDSANVGLGSRGTRLGRQSSGDLPTPFSKCFCLLLGQELFVSTSVVHVC